MKKILVSGDSWTSGAPLEETVPREKFTWPNLVAQHFECDLVDTSRSGSSNYRIYRKGFEGILDGSVDTVIIFLSSWVRWETGSTIAKSQAEFINIVLILIRRLFERIIRYLKIFLTDTSN